METSCRSIQKMHNVQGKYVERAVLLKTSNYIRRWENHITFINTFLNAMGWYEERYVCTARYQFILNAEKWIVVLKAEKSCWTPKSIMICQSLNKVESWMLEVQKTYWMLIVMSFHRKLNFWKDEEAQRESSKDSFASSWIKLQL